MKEASLDAIHAIMEAFLFLFEIGSVFLEIMEAVLLAERSETKEKDSRHGEELNEAVFTLQSISNQT